MVEKEKVCKLCKRFVEDEECPACRAKEFTKTWKGIVIVNDPNESEIAKLLGITAPGRYAIWVK
jgi:DNA-directed RNA polymerase subunit E"